MKRVAIGDHVIFVDEVSRHLNALVTAVWGVSGNPGYGQFSEWDETQPGAVGPALNLVFVDQNPAKKDDCGRQISRNTSIPHRSGTPAPGFFWTLPEEK